MTSAVRSREMARLPRKIFPDGLYHVTTRGVAGIAIFLDDDDRLFFLRLLAEVVRRHAWRSHAFCLMTNHYHLVVETLRENLSDGVRRLNGVYAQRFNLRYGRTGHLFGDRFWVAPLETEGHLRETCRYVLLNPVRAGLCGEPAAWPWSASRIGFDVS
jgi:putative transposase